MASSLGIAPLLKPSISLNSKWLERDVEDICNLPKLQSWYNELLADNEVFIRQDTFLNRAGVATHLAANGHYYCGQEVLTCDCCNAICGPNDGCNCQACQEIENELRENKDADSSSVSSPQELVEAWTWGQLPTLQELGNFAKLVSQKQLQLFRKSAESCLSMQRLKCRLLVYSRFLAIYSLKTVQDNSKSAHRGIKTSSQSHSLASVENPESQFADAGMKIFLNFTFKFIEKAWSSGMDNLLCSRFLDECLSLLQAVSSPLFFLHGAGSAVWGDVFTKASEFLERAIDSPETGSLPRNDKEKSLVLLFEIAFQHASLSRMMHVLFLCQRLCSTVDVFYHNGLRNFVNRLYNECFKGCYIPAIVEQYVPGTMLQQPLKLLPYSSGSNIQEIPLKMASLQILQILHHCAQPYMTSSRPEQDSKKDVFVYGNLKSLSTLKEDFIEDSIKIATMCCTDNFMVLLSLDGNLYSCQNEAEKLILVKSDVCSNLGIVQITCSFAGNFIAVTRTHKVLVWVVKDDSSKWDKADVVPVPIVLQDRVRKICAGYGFYAVLTVAGDLYIWENTKNVNDSTHPQWQTINFQRSGSPRIIDVSLSQFYAEVIVVTEDGHVWGWHDANEMRKDDQVQKPVLMVDEHNDIEQVLIAKYFYVAIRSCGIVMRWGRDRKLKRSSLDKISLKPVEKLSHEKIKTISVGVYHCIALSESGSVYCWGGLGGVEEEESVIREPVLLKTVSKLGITHIATGPHQIFCWSVSIGKAIEKRVPFCLEISEQTFREIENMLSLLCLAMPDIDHDLEERIVYCLNLLRLQLRAAVEFAVAPESIGFMSSSQFSLSLKNRMMYLATEVSSRPRIQMAAQAVLEEGWLILLPTAMERASTLSKLMSSKFESASNNQAFMMKLLMDSLLQNSGLEEILETTLQIVIAKSKHSEGTSLEGSLTLSELLKELFVNHTISVVAALHGKKAPLGNEQAKKVFEMLLAYQRVLFARLFQITPKDKCWPAKCYVFEPSPEIRPLYAFFSHFITLMTSSAKEVLTSWCSTNSIGWPDRNVILQSSAGTLLNEFILCMVLLQNYAPVIASGCDSISHLADLLDLLDKFNKVDGSLLSEDKRDLDWDVSSGACPETVSAERLGGLPVITQDDLDNACAEQRNWVAHEGRVYDMDYLNKTDSLGKFAECVAGAEVSLAMQNAFKKMCADKSAEVNDYVERLTVGILAPKRNSDSALEDSSWKVLFIDMERSLAFLLGLHCCYLAHGMHPALEETDHKLWLKSDLFSGGMDRDMILRDQLPADLSKDGEFSVHKLVAKTISKEMASFVSYLYCQSCLKMPNLIIPMELDYRHPLEHASRAILAAMICHVGLEKEACIVYQYYIHSETNKLLSESSESLSALFLEAVKTTLRQRTAVFKKHQESSNDYESICEPIIRQCEFLCSCVHPAMPSKRKLKHGGRWLQAVERINLMDNRRWSISKWKKEPRFGSTSGKKIKSAEQIMKEICLFAFLEKMNLDVLRKCLLIQIKRAKQRLIAGYLFQSLTLRQYLFSSVKYAMVCGWMGILVPGGVISNAKPNIKHNIELVSQEDIRKLSDVFRGLELHSVKMLLDELDQLQKIDNVQLRSKALISSSRTLITSLSMLTAAFMSGDIGFLIECGLFEKIQMILSFLGVPDQSSLTSAYDSYIDEAKHKSIHLQELSGEEMVSLMKLGARVKRGPDWKWEDQDGPAPSLGRIVSEIGEDGWVRVQWDHGKINSYRIGRAGKYDLALAEMHLDADGDDKDENFSEKVQVPGDNLKGLTLSEQSPLMWLRHTCKMVLYKFTASAAACSESISYNAVTRVKRIFQRVSIGWIEDPKSILGVQMHEWATYGYLSALCQSQAFRSILSTEDHVKELLHYLDLSLQPGNKILAHGSHVRVLIQLVQLISRLIVGDPNVSFKTCQGKRNIVGTIFRLLAKVLVVDNLYGVKVKKNGCAQVSMSASSETTIAEEIIALICTMQSSKTWCEMINLQIWSLLLHVKQGHAFGENLPLRCNEELFTALVVIAGVDSRVRYGAYVRHGDVGFGTVANIFPSGKLLVFFGSSAKARITGLTKVEVVRRNPFSILSFAEFCNDDAILSMIVKRALKPYAVQFSSATQPLTRGRLLSFRISVALLQSVHVLFKATLLWRKVCQSSSKDAASNGLPLVHFLLDSAVTCSPVQSIYDRMELEAAALILSEDLARERVLPAGSVENTPSVDLKDAFKSKTSITNSPTEYENAVGQQGASHEASSDLEAVWMLDRSDAQMFDNDVQRDRLLSRGGSEQDDHDCPFVLHSQAPPGADCEHMPVLERGTADGSAERFKPGNIVKCIKSYQQIKRGDVGAVLQVRTLDDSILVHWEKQDKALWITSEKLDVSEIDEPKPFVDENDIEIKRGSKVRIKSSVLAPHYKWGAVHRESVGTVKAISSNAMDCVVSFPEQASWTGRIEELEVVSVSHVGVGCNICQVMPIVGPRFKCKTCFDFDMCSRCFSATMNHKHKFVKYAEPGKVPVEAGRPGRWRKHESCPRLISHPCIKEIIASSNEQLSANLISQELDSPWLSDAAEMHWIRLKMHSNVIVDKLWISVDPNDKSTHPSNIELLGGNSEYDLSLIDEFRLEWTSSVVSLIESANKVYGVLEIRITDVHDGGKTCKIQHLGMSGHKKVRDYDEQIMAMFLADSDERDNAAAQRQSSVSQEGPLSHSQPNREVKVFVWGLNDKDQLGGLKGSKIKTPTFSEMLSSLHCQQIVGGSKMLLALTREGKVYACGESTNGRLGLGPLTGNSSVPRMLDALSGVVVTKISVHSGGKHAMALTANGGLYSWGEGEDGQLGHGNKLSLDRPLLLEAFAGKSVTGISCGSSHSAAIVDNRDLYTWGLGDLGRLGHGDELCQLKPKLVQAMSEFKVTDVSCGSRDAQSICLTEDGAVWSWGDGDFGKLGRGGSEGCLVPALVPVLTGIGVCRILCGAQFSLALTSAGRLWTWGKGDFFRLGHGNDEHTREPRVVEALKDKRIVDVAVGALHCLCVTDEGEVFAWGDNDHGQQGTGTTTVNKMPTRVLDLEGHRISHVACGSSHSIAWAEVNAFTPIISDPLLFPLNRDPLGASSIRLRQLEHDPTPGITKFLKEHRPSLSKTILQLKSRALQQESFQIILASLQVRSIRNGLLAFLKEDALPVSSHPRSAAVFSYKGDVLSQMLSSFSGADVRVLIKLLKLGLAGHLRVEETDVLGNVLEHMCDRSIKVARTVLDVCISELQERVDRDLVVKESYKPCVEESLHPYHGAPGVATTGTVSYPGAAMLVVDFNELCQTERGQDCLTIMDGGGRTLAVRSGHVASDWNNKLRISGSEMRWSFTANSAGGLWGFSFTVTPTPPVADVNLETKSDRRVFATPSLALVKMLLDGGALRRSPDTESVVKIASLLATCIQSSLVSNEDKQWMLEVLHFLLLTENAPSFDVPTILCCSQFKDAAVCKVKTFGDRADRELVLSSSLPSFICGIPDALLTQYRYEELQLSKGDQMLHSSFLRALATLACSLGLDSLPCCGNKHLWAWFSKFCTTLRVSESLLAGATLPRDFVEECKEKLAELTAGEVLDDLFLDTDSFGCAQDRQLLAWMNRRPQDWSILSGGSGLIYGWGHNHRGQLAGVNGAKVKNAVVCDLLAALKPVQITGGEQTLFCLSADGKVYATGYGMGGRLGLGMTETINTPRMIESLQHITIKKIAVHSGGRHSLALSSDGEVFSWGEGDDGKLGHGNRLSCNHPKLIESFRGKIITDIACGGSHSAAINDEGQLYTWGKGRYGRLGHGDCEDQLRPKIIEAFLNYKVVDVACGSGDAQTLVVTHAANADAVVDAVWSFGDGDYGKLGRGGSDGCVVPKTIDELAQKGVIKVECGSQFSVALTKAGKLYTWGKGDYYRLGHGNENHVRTPKLVAELESKIITAVSCGSLHCVVCTEDGDVYCWGDNDEGQLGDGSTNAGKVPRLMTTLQGKKIDRVACGSAHSVAWSTSQSATRSYVRLDVPVEFNHLQGIQMSSLRNRAYLLHCFSKLFSSCIPMLDLVRSESPFPVGKGFKVELIKDLLLSSLKENFFRKVVDTTMVRDRQHGPVIELNRVQVKKSKSGVASSSRIGQTVFQQMTAKITQFSVDDLCLPHRVWKVKFVGESVDDCGGGYSESIAEMCEELQNGSLPLLIHTANSREDGVEADDYFILNPKATDKQSLDMYNFLGVLIGVAIRTGSPLSLNLAELVWKQLVGEALLLEDFEDVDRGFVTKHSYIQSIERTRVPEKDEYVVDAIPNKDFEPGQAVSTQDSADVVAALHLPFSVRSACGDEIALSATQQVVTSTNRSEYLQLALNLRLHEFDRQVQAIRGGMAQVVPVPLLSLFSGDELEDMVCGSPEIPVEAFKSITTYNGVDPLAPLVRWFWDTLEEFTNHERSLFLRFVWGRTRLPRTSVDFKGKDFIFQVLDKYNPADAYLPESYTCFFMLKLPRYTSRDVLRDKLKYAIYFCKSIDSDEYARIDLTTP